MKQDLHQRLAAQEAVAQRALPTKPTRDATTTPRQQLRDGTAIGIRWAIIGFGVCEVVAVVKYWAVIEGLF